MFGYVIADQHNLSEQELQRYKSCYCGLCRTIGHQYGSLQRCALNYDLVFLVLLLQSLYEPQETQLRHRCLLHPVHPRVVTDSEITAYGAAMNIALTYYKQLDDWQDEKKLTAYAMTALFRRNLADLSRQYPRQCREMTRCISLLGEYEQQNLQDPDVCANAFGNLMAELMVIQDDRWSKILRKLGHALGRFIYLLDAVLDLDEDIRHGRYNPLFRMYHNGWTPEQFRPLLTIIMGECTEAFEQLPLVQDLHLLRNILYSGVWIKLDLALSRKEKHHV